MKKSFVSIPPILLFLLILLTLAPRLLAEGSPEGSSQEGSPESPNTEKTSSLYLQLVDGLHVTGRPIAIDLKTYRLNISGAVDTPLALTFDEVKALDAVEEIVELNCPGFFVDKGKWKGVPIADLLRQAGVQSNAKNLVFISADNGYRSTLPLEAISEPGFLIAYEFDGRPFPDIHGFPLRVVAAGKAGSYWVKWLGEIRVE